MGVTAFIAALAIKFISATGYISIFILMCLESMVFPIPSEAVMPFVGFLVAEGRFTFAGAIIVSMLASITGSVLSYWIGLYGGKPFLNKFGKYLLLDHEDLEFTEKFFSKYGEITILISRFIPVIRHLISIPAGIGKMNFPKFIIYTAIGATCWNTILTVAGFYLKKNWESIMKYSHVIDIVIVTILGLLGALYIYRHLAKKKGRKA